MTPDRAVALLRAVSILTIVVGVVAALGAAESTEGLWVWLFDLLDWPLDDDPSTFDERGRQLSAVLGGVMVGWAVLMLAIVTHQFGHGDYRLAIPMAWSVGAWFVVDSTGSIVAGLPGNVVLNVTFVALYVPPLLTLRTTERQAQNASS